MNFSKMCKKVKLEVLYERDVEPSDLAMIHAQHNPDRYKSYLSCTTPNAKRPMEMINSPHIKIVKDKFAGPYYKMLKLYGRKHKWIEEKIAKFRILYGDILMEHIQEPPIVLIRPLVPIPGHENHEIWEGHHRIACCIALGVECPIEFCDWSLI